MCLCPEYSILCVSYVLLYFEYNVRMYRTTVHVRLVSKEPKNQEVSREKYFSFSPSPNPQPRPFLRPTDRSHPRTPIKFSKAPRKSRTAAYLFFWGSVGGGGVGVVDTPRVLGVCWRETRNA